MKLNALSRAGNRRLIPIFLLPAAAAGLAILIDDLSFGRQFDQYAYDFLYRLEKPRPWTPGSAILAIDEKTLAKYGGQSGIRDALADGLERITPAKPVAVAVDIILAEPGSVQADERLEQAFANTRNLVLASYAMPDGTWNEPLERFRKYAVAVGQVHADFDRYDTVSRDLPLAKAAGRDRRWALAFDTFLAAHGFRVDEESPHDLLAGPIRIPTAQDEEHVIRIRYRPPEMGGILRVSLADLDANPGLAGQFAGKAVFAGETAQARDSWMTPYSNGNFTPGIEINASLYETLAQRWFAVDAPAVAILGACLALAIAITAAYAFTSGWIAILLAASIAAMSQAIPAAAFASQVIWPWLPGTLAALFSIAGAAAWKHLLVRRDLARAEHQRTRYQQAMQFVTHEMRTPLTAIQGSSELIGRYGSMPEAKRKQMAELINSESKRLARMIETFLSVERLSAGQMELKQERFPLPELVERCTERARPLAERKQIAIDIDRLPPDYLTGDRELMEYALYNLLTNAVKYSPPLTRCSGTRTFSKSVSRRLATTTIANMKTIGASVIKVF